MKIRGQVSGVRGQSMVRGLCALTTGYWLLTTGLPAATIESESTDMWFSVPSWMPFSSPDTLTVGSDTSEWFHGLTNTVISVTNMQFSSWTASTDSMHRATLSYSVLRGNPRFTVVFTGLSDSGPQLDAGSGRWKSTVRPYVTLYPNGRGEQPAYSLQLSPIETVCRFWDMPDPGVKGIYDEENANLVRLAGTDSLTFGMSTNTVRIDVSYKEEWTRDLVSAVTNLVVTNSIWLARIDPELRASIVNAYSGAFDRQYFAWEGQSNEWDEAVYGPRSPTNFWFTTTNGFCDGWCRDEFFDVWPHEKFRDYGDTNAWQELSREHSDTHYRRLFGYSNYWHFVWTHLMGWESYTGQPSFSRPFDADRPFWEPRIPFYRYNGLGYAYGGMDLETVSRWATTAAMPKDAPETDWPEFSWTASPWTYDWAGTLYKLDRLTNDEVFVDMYCGEYADGLAGASAERAIREVAFGDFDSWGENTNAWNDIRPYRLNSSWMDVLTNEFESASPSAGYALGIEDGRKTRRLFLEPLALASQSISLLDRTYDEYPLHSVSATVWSCSTSMTATNSFEVGVRVTSAGYGTGIDLMLDFENDGVYGFDGYSDMSLSVVTNFIPCQKRAFTVRVSPTWTNDPLVEDHSSAVLELPDVGEWLPGGSLFRHSADWFGLVTGETLVELGEEAMEAFGSPRIVEDWHSLFFQLLTVELDEYGTRARFFYDVTLTLSNGMYYAATIETQSPDWYVGTTGMVSCTVYIDREYTTKTVDLSWEHYEPFGKWAYRPGWSLERGALVDGTWSLLSLMGYGSTTNEVGIDANCYPRAGDTYLYQSGSEGISSNREFWNAVAAKQDALRNKAVADAGARIGGTWNWPAGHIPIYPGNFGGHVHCAALASQHFDVRTFELSIVHGEDTPANTPVDWLSPTWGLPASAFRPRYVDRDTWEYVSTTNRQIVGIPFPVALVDPGCEGVEGGVFELYIPGDAGFRHRPQDEGVVEHSAYSGDGKCELINKVDWRFKHLRRGTE